MHGTDAQAPPGFRTTTGPMYVVPPVFLSTPSRQATSAIGDPAGGLRRTLRRPVSTSSTGSSGASGAELTDQYGGAVHGSFRVHCDGSAVPRLSPRSSSRVHRP